MSPPKNFPQSPYEILAPEIRWSPVQNDLFEKYRLLPPLVEKLRKEVADWRAKDYENVSPTSRALLRWWFQTDHPVEAPDGTTYFQYYFAQREAVETIIYCYEIAKIKDKYDFFRYDSSGAISANMFPEEWLRLVIKMATGSGKTKVMSLLIAWSYFHKLYENDSKLARNFLLITPNIIVLDRIKEDFNGLKIFYEDPILPENGYEGQNWKDDFQVNIHMQDDVRTVAKTGNIFLTNIHRIYSSKDSIPTADDNNTMDYYLGEKPVANTSDSKVNLGDIVRDVDELMVLNDEAHHIHDERLAWFKSIEDISNQMKMKGAYLSLQVDVTATPKHNNGSIFVQTVSDYSLVEAIYQDVVKHPVLPDAESRAKLQEHQSVKFTEKYEDYIHLGYLEWKKAYQFHEKMQKKAVFFIMTDDTRNCDDVAEYLIANPNYPEFASEKDVLVIHTKQNGEISESTTGKKEEDLKKLRQASNEIDDWNSPYKAIVSVLMLKEGWDTKNVTTIVGLRAYTAKSNILPEQTLGRGLRRMYRGNEITEYVSVVGTDAFINFVESIKAEGVELQQVRMGAGTGITRQLVIEVDNANTNKDIAKLDIKIPIMSSRIYREYSSLSELDVAAFTHTKLKIIEFSEEEKKEIVFRDVTTDEKTHTTEWVSDFVPSYQSVIGYFIQIMKKDLRLVSGHDVLYAKIKEFVINYLFEQTVDLKDLNILRNLSELEVTKTIIETFKREVNKLTIIDRGAGVEIRDYIKISKTRPFIVKEQSCIDPKKSVFNKIIGDSGFELEFAAFLEDCDDIVSYAKNYFAVHFKIDYKDADGYIRNYYPDFIVKISDGEVYIVETKGREDLDGIEKIHRLYQWCDDINAAQDKVRFKALYVKQEDFQQYTPKNFASLVKSINI